MNRVKIDSQNSHIPPIYTQQIFQLNEVSDYSFAEQIPATIISQSIPNMQSVQTLKNIESIKSLDIENIYSKSQLSSQSLPIYQELINLKDNTIRKDMVEESLFPSPQVFKQLVSLRQMNKKLISDNKALFDHCIQLSKFIQDSYEMFNKLPIKNKQKQQQQGNSLQISIIKPYKQLDLLRDENKDLKRQLLGIQQYLKLIKQWENRQSKSPYSDYDEVLKLKTNTSLLNRLNIQNIKDISYYKTQSQQNSKHYCYKNDNSRDQTISNSKFVGEGQNNKLRIKVKEQTEQIESLRNLLQKISSKLDYY